MAACNTGLALKLDRDGSTQPIQGGVPGASLLKMPMSRDGRMVIDGDPRAHMPPDHSIA